MQTLRERGYQFPKELKYNREEYRHYSALILENNDLLPSEACPMTVDVLAELYLSEFGLEFIYVEGLKERVNAYGATTSIPGCAPQIYLDASLRDASTQTLRKLHISTIAHELGHAFLHNESLRMRSAALTDSMSVFMTKEDCEYSSWFQYCFGCYRKNGPMSSEKFLEFQANQIMVGLLMPFSTLYDYVVNAVKLKLAVLNQENGWDETTAFHNRTYEVFDFVVREVSNRYQVSKQMAALELYRISQSEEINRIFYGIVPADPVQKKSYHQYSRGKRG